MRVFTLSSITFVSQSCEKDLRLCSVVYVRGTHCGFNELTEITKHREQQSYTFELLGC